MYSNSTMKYLSHVVFFQLISSVIAEFPLDNPCLQTCANTELKASVLQKCVDICLENGFCYGNRLAEGACTVTAANLLSCSNGCEIAYYSSSVDQCKAYCVEGNDAFCEYFHPYISNPFGKCWDCPECDVWPPLDACSTGCDYAAEFEDFYQFIEPSEEGSCEQDDIPRFLFAGQSNMVSESCCNCHNSPLYLQSK